MHTAVTTRILLEAAHKHDDQSAAPANQTAVSSCWHVLARQGFDTALLSNQVLYGACSTMPVAMLLFRTAAEPLPAMWLMHACMHLYDVHAADGQQRCFPRHWVRQQTQSLWQASIAAAGWRAPRHSLVLVSQVSPGASSEAAGKHATTAGTQQQQHAQP